MSKAEEAVRRVQAKLAESNEVENGILNKQYAVLKQDMAARVAGHVMLEEDFSVKDFLSNDNRVKIASLADLFQFARIGNETLVHKSSNDLWKVEMDKEGQTYISQLFDPASGQPLKG